MNRVPPHDLDAEESLLGAMMLSRDGRRAGLNLCSGADFYKANHVAFFDAVETLFHQGSAVDPVTVSHQLDRAGVLEDVGGRSAVSRVMASTPASANAEHYARIVSDAAAARRAIRLGGDLADAGYDSDHDKVAQLLRDAPELVAPPMGTVDPGIEVPELAAADYPERVLVPGLLHRADRLIVTGREGGGKSTLLRMIAVMLACGLHPFDYSPVPTLRSLVVDLENDVSDIAYAMRALLNAAGDRYAGKVWVKSRPQGMNLRARRDVRWLDGLCKHHRPDILVLGPLYKSYRGAEGSAKSSEEAAEDVMAELDELRTRYDMALLIEAHAPHGEGGDRARWRPRGSAAWLGWPEWGWGLAPEGETSVRLVDWRGVRRRGHTWPWRLQEGSTWPWETPPPMLEAVK